MPYLNDEGQASAAFGATWLPLLREMLDKEGSFRFPLRGTSMCPTLPTECDIVITPLPANVPLGKPIVFLIDNTLIAHRLVRRSGGRWIAQGDGRLGPDRPLAPEQVLGVLSAAYQDGRQIWPRPSSNLLAVFWVARHWVLWPALVIRRALR